MPQLLWTVRDGAIDRVVTAIQHISDTPWTQMGRSHISGTKGISLFAKANLDMITVSNLRDHDLPGMNNRMVGPAISAFGDRSLWKVGIAESRDGQEREHQNRQ